MMARAIVVGAGGISRAWFGPLTKQGVQIAAVVDLNKEAAQARIDQYELAGTVALDDLDKALAEHESDFVVDLTIPAAHCEVTCKALEAGRHVIGEKPMAESFDQALKMVDTAKNSGKLYMVSQSRRWNPGVLEVADAISTRKLGKLTAMHCDFFLRSVFQGFRAEMDHVLLVDMAIHHFDLARKMSGVDPVSVYAEDYLTPESWARDGIGAAALFRMTDEVRFTYTGNWSAPGHQNGWDGDWRLQCSQGAIHYENNGQPRAYRSTGENLAPPVARVDVTVDQPQTRGMHAALLEMLAFLEDGTMPQSECQDNIKSFAMVCAAVESCETGKPVDITKMLA